MEKAGIRQVGIDAGHGECRKINQGKASLQRERAREGRGQPGPWGGRVVGDEVGTLGQFGETRGDLGGWE